MVDTEVRGWAVAKTEDQAVGATGTLRQRLTASKQGAGQWLRRVLLPTPVGACGLIAQGPRHARVTAHGDGAEHGVGYPAWPRSTTAG